VVNELLDRGDKSERMGQGRVKVERRHVTPPRVDIELAFNAYRLKRLVSKTAWFSPSWFCYRLDSLSKRSFGSGAGLQAGKKKNFHVLVLLSATVPDA
jgi:hypothetical protein